MKMKKGDRVQLTPRFAKFRKASVARRIGTIYSTRAECGKITNNCVSVTWDGRAKNSRQTIHESFLQLTNEPSKERKNMKQSIVLIYSGGLDSTALLLKLLADDHSVRCLSVNYGQRHKKELTAATKICETLQVEHQVIDLTALLPLLKGSSQTDAAVPVPHGHYAAENMKLTVVPNRNMILLAVAGAWAISTKADAIAYAAHAGDHDIYPDCRETFVKPLVEALQNADWHKVELVRPFLKNSKGEIAQIGLLCDQDRMNRGLPSVLQYSWTCYEGGEQPCGKCGACVERAEAFQFTRQPDPALI